uniref:Putative ovule protein n=1 Tax=Solanum chacoense TaxID=4108 RepID=A0A0V0H4M9_SOLCH
MLFWLKNLLFSKPNSSYFIYRKQKGNRRAKKLFLENNSLDTHKTTDSFKFKFKFKRFVIQHHLTELRCIMLGEGVVLLSRFS